MMKPSPAIGVGAFVFDPQGRVLLVRRARDPNADRWAIPGGRLMAGETLAQGVAREVHEETGLIVEVGPLACVVEVVDDAHHYVVLDYLGRVIGGTLGAADDVTDARYVAVDELSRFPVVDGLEALVARARLLDEEWQSRTRS